MSLVEHVTGDEKYECWMLKVLISESKIDVGSVYCASLKGVVFWDSIFISLV